VFGDTDRRAAPLLVEFVKPIIDCDDGILFFIASSIFGVDDGVGKG